MKIITDIKLLRQPSEPVSNFWYEHHRLIRQLEQSLDTTKGIGLCAIQIGIAKRIGGAYKQAPGGPPGEGTTLIGFEKTMQPFAKAMTDLAKIASGRAGEVTTGVDEIGAALQNVDYDEIATHMIEEIEEAIKEAKV